MTDLLVAEGVSGMWHYHLSKGGEALCGATTMRASIPIEDWGKSFGEHFPKRPTWCATCAAKANIGAKSES